MKIQVATFDELPAGTLYALLRLRVDVFVVEQDCPYPELDGRDTEPTARHVWLVDDESAGPDAGRVPSGAPPTANQPLAYLRVLTDPDGVRRIGRVCVAEKARGAGHAQRLMATALSLVGDRPARLDAQSHLVGFYASFGFLANGPEYLEDGIPHTPMHRPAPNRA